MDDPAALDQRARAWFERGSYYTWTPRDASGSDRSVRVFHVEAGDPSSPLLVLVHGWPTSSIDWCDVVGRLSDRYRVSMLDFPGYGFSEKPPDWPYGLELDAQLLRHHVTEFLGADRCRVLAHDRGDSVALVLHEAAVRGGSDAGLELEHLVLTNGNIFLPLANVTTFQKLLLDPSRGGEVAAALTPEALAQGLGAATFTPTRLATDPTVVALESSFRWAHGTSVMDRTIRYLRERADHETAWLDSLSSSSVPTSLIWGICDTVAPPRVAMHVWETYLRGKPGSNELWMIPAANHYLQNDRPDAFADAVLHSLELAGDAPPGAVGDAPDAPVRIDQSRPGLPKASEQLQP